METPGFEVRFVVGEKDFFPVCTVPIDPGAHSSFYRLNIGTTLSGTKATVLGS
jgi:hypothetical protein